MRNRSGSPAEVPYPIQESGHHGDGKLEVRPARERAEQGEHEGEIKKEFEGGRGGVVGLSNDPVGEQEECGREDNEVVDGEMRRE